MTPSKGNPQISQDDQAAPRFLVVDQKVPAAIRQLLDEADGCANMGFLNGGAACARRAIETILLNEHAWLDDDYAASLLKLSEKHPAVPTALFQILEMLSDDSDEAMSADSVKALVVTIKAVVHEIYVLGVERVERLMYVHQMVEALKRESGSRRHS